MHTHSILSFGSTSIRDRLQQCAHDDQGRGLPKSNRRTISTRFRILDFAGCGLIAAVILAWSCTGATAASAFGEWKALLNGTNGWHSFKKTTFPDKGWVIDPDHSLHHLAKGGGGDLVSEGIYDDFELRWDWKVAAGANSGVKYFVSEDRSQALGHEYQLIDDTSHPDALRGPKWQTASFYDVLPAQAEKNLKPVGEWNKARVVVRGNRVEHWLNGIKVLQYELGSPELKAAVAGSKFKEVTNPGFGTKFKGHILLQDHGDEIWFREIRIRERLPGRAGAPPRTSTGAPATPGK